MMNHKKLIRLFVIGTIVLNCFATNSAIEPVEATPRLPRNLKWTPWSNQTTQEKAIKALKVCVLNSIFSVSKLALALFPGNQAVAIYAKYSTIKTIAMCTLSIIPLIASYKC